MKKKLIPLLSAILTVTLLATLALFSGATTTEPKLKIAYCNINFKLSSHILYAVTYEGIESENVDDIELLVWKTPQTDYKSDPDYTLEVAGKETIDGDECVVFDFSDIEVKNIIDNIYTRAHIKVDGEDYYSPVNKYSVLQYAYNILGKTKENGTNDTKLITVLNDLLKWGEDLQIYTKYKIDRLATAD